MPIQEGLLSNLLRRRASSCSAAGCLLVLALLASTLPAHGAEPVNKLNLCSRTPQNVIRPVDEAIFKTVSDNDVAKLRAALGSGTNPNSTDEEGFSLLHAALTQQRDAILDLLLKSGVDVNLPFMGSSPLALARSSSGPDKASQVRIEKLVKAGAVLSDFDEAFATAMKYPFNSMTNGFVDAMTRGDMQRLEVYARATYDINESLDKAGITPLHVAAIQGTPAAIRYLVKCGANLNARTKNGAPVLWFAKDRPEAKALLVELGATEKD